MENEKSIIRIMLVFISLAVLEIFAVRGEMTCNGFNPSAWCWNRNVLFWAKVVMMVGMIICSLRLIMMVVPPPSQGGGEK
ncbi:hypothetical protein A3C67_02965 [Candidatus Nomurabacteria bacterium RIFCSPHIGHO2_02_FULL_42_19]|uniref:Uncharacterized protein n=1 Tax=Candidatus Nomurabacteria bacterium RIFCSPHIGHO2_02_FULL_42_19 TaxID=1801756 RepID=A0A1F6W1N8_9BACT|nr:MAG: hypothetical protein A3C67_02965 [Candidatus Nomurabacteria bacterium RIFCSPHIGHO2_02_FULL_42_19]